MSITLNNGVVLPDIPGKMLEKYPYEFIFEVVANEIITYAFYSSATKFIYAPKTINGDQNDLVLSESIGAYRIMGDSSGWDENDAEEVTDGKVNIFVGENVASGITISIVWSNHDILTATAKNDDGTYTVGTEIYFPSSVSSEPSFIYGTTVPEIPASILESYPHAFIYHAVSDSTEAYCAYAVKDTTNLCYVENSDSSDGGGIGTINDGVDSALCNYIVGTSTAWSDPTEKTNNSFLIPLGTVTADDGTATMTIVWSNFDIMTAEKDSEDNYVKTDDVYFGDSTKPTGGMTVRIGLDTIVPGCPDIPEGLEDEYPYLAIVKFSMTSAAQIILCASKYPLVHVGNHLMGTGVGYKEYNCYIFNSVTNQGWELSEESVDTAFKQLTDYTMSSMTYTTTWSNHDIMAANETSVSGTTLPTASTTVYFQGGNIFGTYTLPELPELYEGYPYISMLATVSSGALMFVLITSGEEGYFAPAGTILDSKDIITSSASMDVGHHSWFCLPGDSSWSYNKYVDSMESVQYGSIGQNNIYCPVWINHDVFVVGDLDAVNNKLISSAQVWRWGDDVERETMTIDGVDIPMLPDRIAQMYPYACMLVIYNEDGTTNMYAYLGLRSIPYAIPGSLREDGVDAMCYSGDVVMYALPETFENWVYYGEDTVETTNAPLEEDETGKLLWTNFDMYTASNVDDLANPVMTTDLYRKSDDSYTVTGSMMTELANQARILGGVTGLLKPDEIEAIFAQYGVETETETTTETESGTTE